MKPTTKPKRTAEQCAEAEAVRREHAANPIRQQPAGTPNRQSFAAILRLVAGGAVQNRTGNRGTDAGRGRRAHGDRPAGSLPIRNG
jgi:hypothetical protein